MNQPWVEPGYLVLRKKAKVALVIVKCFFSPLKSEAGSLDGFDVEDCKKLKMSGESL